MCARLRAVDTPPLKTVKSILFALPLLVSVTTGWATGSFVDVQYLADAKLEADDGAGNDSVGGDGFAVDVSFDLTERGFFYGTFFSRNYEENGARLDLDQARFGLGLLLGASEFAAFWIGGGTERLRLSGSALTDSASGFSLHAGVILPLRTGAALLGRVAYLDIENSTGAELDVGISVPAGHGVDLIGNYRLTSIEDTDGPATLTLTDLSIGLRFEY